MDKLNMGDCRTNYYQQFDIYQVSVAVIWAWKMTRKVLFLNREFDGKTTFSSIKFRMLAMVVLYIAWSEFFSTLHHIIRTECKNNKIHIVFSYSRNLKKQHPKIFPFLTHNRDLYQWYVNHLKGLDKNYHLEKRSVIIVDRGWGFWYFYPQSLCNSTSKALIKFRWNKM